MHKHNLLLSLAPGVYVSAHLRPHISREASENDTIYISAHCLVFHCNSPLLTNCVEMAITADGSLVFAVIFLTASCIDFVKTSDKSQAGTRQECCHSKASLDHTVISPAASLTSVGLFREAVQSGAVRCRLLVF